MIIKLKPLQQRRPESVSEILPRVLRRRTKLPAEEHDVLGRRLDRQRLEVVRALVRAWGKDSRRFVMATRIDMTRLRELHRLRIETSRLLIKQSKERNQ